MKLIVGLGNPGIEYEKTRHNAGFLSVDALVTDEGAAWSEDAKHHAWVAKCQIAGTTILLAKPTTFMNLSGEAATALASYYKVGPEDILIVQDEMDLPPGAMAFLAKGGAAGHNGITSIQELFGRSDIDRLRIGIGRPEGLIPTEDWVLQNADERTLETIARAPDAIRTWITDGLDAAMTQWNKRA